MDIMTKVWTTPPVKLVESWKKVALKRRQERHCRETKLKQVLTFQSTGPWRRRTGSTHQFSRCLRGYGRISHAHRCKVHISPELQIIEHQYALLNASWAVPRISKQMWVKWLRKFKEWQAHMVNHIVPVAFPGKRIPLERKKHTNTWGNANWTERAEALLTQASEWRLNVFSEHYHRANSHVSHLDRFHSAIQCAKNERCDQRNSQSVKSCMPIVS